MKKLFILLCLIFTCIPCWGQPCNPHQWNGKIKWDAANWATGYYVYYGQNKNSLIFKKDVGNTTEIDMNSLEYADSDHCWWISVSAYNEHGEGNRHTPILVCPFSRKYTLVWKESSDPDIAGYLIYWRIEDMEAYPEKPLYNVTTNQVDTPALTPGRTYYFMIYPYDKAGNKGTGLEISITPTGLQAPEEMDTTAPQGVSSAMFLEK